MFDVDDLINVLVSLRTEADSVPSNKTQPLVLTSANSFPLQTLRFGETAILRQNRLLLATSQDLWLHSVSVQMGVLAVVVKSIRKSR